MYFRGFHKARDQWDEQAYEARCAEVFSDALDSTFLEAQEFAESFPPRWRERIFRDVIEDFVDIEKTFRFLKHHDASPGEMEDVFYYGDYYSDRHMDAGEWLDEPRKELPLRYPDTRGRGASALKRCRARQDPWWTVSFYIEV